MMRFLGIFLTGLWVVLLALPVRAAELGVRVNDHQSLVRLVLAWPDAGWPGHTLRVVDDRTVEIALAGAGTVPAFTPSPTIPEIVDVRRVSDPEAPLKIWIMTSGAPFRREVQVGGRLLLDFAQDPKLRTQAARAAAAPPKVTTPVAAAPKPVPAATVPVPVPTPQAVAASPVPAVARTPLAPAPLVFDPADPPVLTLAATSAFGMAAFVNNGTLWVVVDNPDFIGTPKFSGRNAHRLPPFDRQVTKEATVFKLDLPSSVTAVRGEGGDLLWRVVFAPPRPQDRPLSLTRREENGQRDVIIPIVGATKIIPLDDLRTGQTHKVVTVAKSTEFMGPPRRLAEFMMPLAPIGIVVTPLVDDLEMTTADNAVIIRRAGTDGLSVTSALEAQTYQPPGLAPPPSVAETAPAAEVQTAPDLSGTVQQLSEAAVKGMPLFRFDRWAMGGPNSLFDNETALIADMADKEPGDRAGGLMNVGKMYLANGRGGEAVGYFRLALDAESGLAETPEFIALRGAAYAVNGQFDLAYEDLRGTVLDIYPDINVWRAYVLANLQDWQQASTKLGQDFSWVRQYPDVIAQPMILAFAEIALRAGQTKQAQSILGAIDPAGGEGEAGKALAVSPDIIPVVAQYDYLQAEAARQTGKKDQARELWEALTKSPDNKYRARARLALTVLDYEEGKIKAPAAIDQLEGLRYAWRGDEVEAAINARLGEIYLDNSDYLRGLNALKEAATMAGDTDMGRRVTASMTDSFRSIFTGDRAKKVDPLDAITVYEKFGELVPAGAEGSRLIANLIDRLMEVDLLDRAAKVLSDLTAHRLTGDDQVQASLRLAAVHILNRQPQAAMNTLNRTAEMFAGVADPVVLDKRKRELSLLRARAQFQGGQVDAALSTLSLLPNDPDVLRARADVAWQTGRWSEATVALEQLIALDPVPENKPPTADQADMIRNLAVATNLSGDRAGLAALRAKYEQAMMQTPLSGEFDVITRERQTPTLADRDTLNKLVSEVDLFGNFLNSYRQSAAEKTAVTSSPPTTSSPDPAQPLPAATTPETVSAD